MKLPLDRPLPRPGHPLPRRSPRGIELGPDANPGEARVCLEHPRFKNGRLECTRKRQTDGTWCHGPAIRGTDKCFKHGGTSKGMAMIKGEAQINAWTALGKPAGGQHIDPGVAVLSMLQTSWMRAAVYGELLRRQVQEARAMIVEQDSTLEGMLVDKSRGESDGTEGLIGYRYGAAGADGHIYKTNEEVRALVVLEAQERDRCVRYAKTAHDMGISDRLTSLAEQWGDVVAGRVADILADLQLTPEQEARSAELITRHLSSIEMNG